MGHPLKPSQHRAAKLKVSRLYLQGMTQSEIAADLKLNQGTISRFLDELSRDWLVEGVFNFNEAKIEQLHKVNALEIEYYDAWRRSIGIKIETTNTERGAVYGTSGDVVTLEDKKTFKYKDVGDPRYLAGIQWCIEQRCKIIGLYAPTKQDVTGNIATAATFSEWIKIETERNKK